MSEFAAPFAVPLRRAAPRFAHRLLAKRHLRRLAPACGCVCAVWLSVGRRVPPAGCPAEGRPRPRPLCAPADKGREGADSQWGSNSSLTAGPRSRRGSNASLYGGEWPDPAWYDLARRYLAWHDLVWSDMTWPDLV